jgi:4-hydroxy-tetrahydrodipicolinate reductase
VLTSIQRSLDRLAINEFADMSSRNSPELIFGLMGFGKDPTSFDDRRWAYGAASFGPSLHVLAEALSLPLDSVEGTGEVAVARQKVTVAAGTLEAGGVAAQRMIVTGTRRGEPLLRFAANWYLTTDIEPEWDLRPTGWQLRVDGDAPLEVDIRFPVPLERWAAVSPGLTANRAVNAVPYVCEAEPGIRTILDLPQIIPTFT